MSEFESQLAELKDLMQRANATPWGKTCSMLWAQAAQLATEIGDETLQVRCYNELCSAYAMGGEHTKVLAPFIWQDKKFKEKPELYDEDLTYQLGWHYKYVISAIRQVPSIPVAKCFEILEEMRKFYLNYGDAMRAYYIRAFLFYRDFGMDEEAEAAYQKWYTAPASKLSDCSRCDPGYEITYYTYHKEWEKAAKAADKAMSSEEKYCDSQPEEVLTQAMLPWLYTGRDNQAWAAHIRAYRRYQQSPRYLANLPEHLLYLGISGRAGRPERLERAVNIISRHLPWFKEAEDPGLLMHLCATVGMVLAAPELEPSKILNGTLAGDEFTWIRASRLENPSYQQASTWFMEIARQLAKQFDERVGHPHPGIASARIADIFNPQTAPAPADKLVVKDSSGLGELENSTYLLSVKAESEVETNTGDDAVKTGEKTENKQDNSDTEEQTEVVAEDLTLPPISLYGDWRKLDLPALLRKDIALGANGLSIYGLTVLEILASNPNIKDSYCLELDCSENQTLLQLDSIANSYLDLESINLLEMPPEAAPGYQLFTQINEALQQRKAMEAAQLADQAMRTDSPEPLGVRIMGLQLMSKAATLAGYYNEAIDSIRQHLNLAAACGLNLLQVQASIDLAALLYRQKQYVSAAEVAQTGLDLEHSLPRKSALILQLHLLLAEASEALEHYETAAKHRFIIAEAKVEENPLEAVKYYQDAAIDYAHNRLYPQSYTAWQNSLNLCQQLYRDKHAEYLEAEKLITTTTAGEEPPETALAVKKQYRDILQQLLGTYYQFCKTIVNQPGQVPDADIQRMENLMEEYRQLELDSLNLVFMSLPPAALEADWHSDMGYMYAQCYKYQLAEDYLQAAIAGFGKIGEVKRQAESYLLMAKLKMIREEYLEAQEICETVLELLKAPKWIGSEIISIAKQIGKEAAARLAE